MNRMLLLVGAALVGSGPALAQTTTAPPGDASSMQAPAGTAGQATSSGGMAAGGATTGGTASGGAAQVQAGAAVNDTSGSPVGRVASVAGGNATIDTGTAKAAVPVTSLAQGPNGLVIGMTKAQLEAAVAANAPPPMQIAVGNTVVGPQGNTVGTVTAVSGDLVTVQTAKTKAQLPTKAFAQKSPGTLAIGLTADQLDSAAKAAGAPSS